MPERSYSRYTREKTWAALYNQHVNAGYALVPYSATNNSIFVIRCNTPEEVQKQTDLLLKHADECDTYYGNRQPLDKVPPILEKARPTVVLARSSDYYHYHLTDHPDFKLVICGLHDSYLHLPVWEMRTNMRYSPHETAVALSSPDFDHLRCTQFGHNILIGALMNGDKTALAFRDTLPLRTQSRINREVDALQKTRYRGRPLAFLTDAERREIGSKISEGLRRYYEKRRLEKV